MVGNNAAKSALILNAVNSIAGLWREGDAEQKSWVWGSLDRIEREFERLSYKTLRARLKATYLRLKKESA